MDGIVFKVFMAIFIISIGTAKIIQIESLLETQTDKNYYTIVASEVIDIQRKVKAQFDEANNYNYTNKMFNHLLFFKIYTKELINHGPIDVDSSSGDKAFYTSDNFSSGTNLYEAVNTLLF